MQLCSYFFAFLENLWTSSRRGSKSQVKKPRNSFDIPQSEAKDAFKFAEIFTDGSGKEQNSNFIAANLVISDKFIIFNMSQMPISWAEYVQFPLRETQINSVFCS